MMNTDREGPDPTEGMAYSVTSYLLAGPLVYGGAGWALGRWLGWDWALPLGILIGLALAIYVIWLRYGRT